MLAERPYRALHTRDTGALYPLSGTPKFAQRVTKGA